MDAEVSAGEIGSDKGSCHRNNKELCAPQGMCDSVSQCLCPLGPLGARYAVT